MIRSMVLLLFLIAPASAYLLIPQGGYVYHKETVDISQAIAWPTFEIVWCSPRNYDCDPPDQVIDVGVVGDMEHYYIDPGVFHYGKYYRWDGSWHRAENAIAFIVMPGTRPIEVNETMRKDAENDTAHYQFKEGPYKYLIARSDSPTLYSVVNRTDPAHLWLFTEMPDTLDIPMERINNTFFVRLNSTVTSHLETGTYNGYIQFDGQNKMQDIFMEGLWLSTPYDKHNIPAVHIVSYNLRSVKEQFDALKGRMFMNDDILIPVTLEVADPGIRITNVEQTEGKILISGVTAWDNRTIITLKLDPENYKLERDIQMHTWQTYLNGGIENERVFNTALNVEKEELYIGPHEVIMTVDKDGYSSETSYTFKVTDTYVMPSPTPERIRLITDENYEPIPTTRTPDPVSTPKVVAANVTMPPTPTPVLATTTATPAPVKTTQTQAPMAEDTIPTIPVNILTVVAAAGAAVFVRSRI